ncbi:DUF3263 domain-containing protein [Tsukamurella asaccharolytica]|uniref:DUF3263 domain-containing protein n=1 Tax=Tsukamurella asaccharolytica TaxID=2592067 RepID=A0A5C5RDN1_9ACTN|nr:DUF3263 domain-containing protein [Tsukamurella asaccharolytica]
MTDVDRQILDFERSWWQQRGSKEDAIVANFGLTPVRYYQRLNQVLDTPEAVAYAPTVVNRLRRIRGGRSQRTRP